VAEPPSAPIAYLRRLLREQDDQTRQMIGDRDRVHAEYGRLFHPDNLDRLTAEDFKGFLRYENNRHWWGIHRHETKLVSDMGRLRRVLANLLDESQPIVKRLDRIDPRTGPKPLPGFGKAVITPILHVVYPGTYGVWNQIAENAMTWLGLWPTFIWGAGFGYKYSAVNTVLKDVADQLPTDLWTIDALWWRAEQDHNPDKHPFEGSTKTPQRTRSARSPTSSQKGTASRFLCSICRTSKPTSLRARTEPDICVDCVD
jgi:hypothetical protein